MNHYRFAPRWAAAFARRSAPVLIAAALAAPLGAIARVSVGLWAYHFISPLLTFAPMSSDIAPSVT